MSRFDEVTAYEGGCHCGAVRYAVDAKIAGAISCNCSICQKTGTMLSFVEPGSFTLKSGEDHLVDYQFNKHVIHHLFCKTCGIRSFARGKKPDGAEMIAINVRCLDGIDANDVPTTKFNGRDR